MFKKIRYQYFTLLIIFSSYCQEKKLNFVTVEYDVNYNTEIPNTKKGILEIDINDEVSYFFLSKSSINSSVTKENDVITIVEKNEKRYLKTTKKEKEILYTDFIKNKTYLIKDSIGSLNWNTNSEETKNIGKTICNKATLYFRGRNYVAWYDQNNPLNFGPWKFHGLPGLILEIYDETKRYHWVASKISYSENSGNSFEADIMDLITFREYTNLRYSDMDSEVSSKLPRGTITQNIKVGRSGIEIKFEWEENEK